MLREGTCKCGLECPLALEKVFDFDQTVSCIKYSTCTPLFIHSFAMFCYLLCVSYKGLLGQSVATVSVHESGECPKNIQQNITNEWMNNCVYPGAQCPECYLLPSFLQKLSEVLAFPRQTSLSRYCAHKKSILSLAAADRTPSFMSRIAHVHNPVLQLKRGFKRRLRKRTKPFSGMKVGQMLEAREVEERRINAVRTSAVAVLLHV